MEKLINKRQLGFSLIEVLIVIAIIAIVATISIPFFGGFVANRNLKSAARDIAGDIFELKARAGAEDRLYQISFNQGANTYTLTQCTNTAVFPCLGNDTTKSLSAFGSGIAISALNLPGGNVIQVQSRGVINPANNAGGFITLINSRGSTASITINLTGRASVDWTGTLL